MYSLWMCRRRRRYDGSCHVRSAELVARLQSENKTLKDQVNTGTLATVHELKNELDDANRLRQSFETVCALDACLCALCACVCVSLVVVAGAC